MFRKNIITYGKALNFGCKVTWHFCFIRQAIPFLPHWSTMRSPVGSEWVERIN